MHTVVDVARWFSDPAHWSGSEGIPARLFQHLWLSLGSLAVAAVIALPIGLWVGHRRRFELLATSIANVGRSIPSFAVLVLSFIAMLNVAPSVAFGPGPTIIALTLLAIPSMLVNTYVGIQTVDPDTVEAARAMGMREGQVLLRLELPLAASLIMTGVRVAALQVVATATLAALIGGGGLGRLIVDGFARGDTPMTVAGASLVSVLALLTLAFFGLVERVVRPRTVSRSA